MLKKQKKELIREFLKTRGLELSEEKTTITHINDGFDMLGWTFRKFKGKLIVKPSKKSIKSFVASLSETILKRGKGKWWVSLNYWHRRGNRNWVFSTENNELLRVDHISIVRHTKVRIDANPYFDTQYFLDRKFEHGMKRLSGRFKLIWKNQNGCCYHCGMSMEISDDREIFFKVPKSAGGKDEVPNMAYVHKSCQQIYLDCRSKEF